MCLVEEAGIRGGGHTGTTNNKGSKIPGFSSKEKNHMPKSSDSKEKKKNNSSHRAGVVSPGVIGHGKEATGGLCCQGRIGDKRPKKDRLE
jgi:hypothetical protein